MKVEEVGDQESIDSLVKNNFEQKLSDIRKSVEETRIRAVDRFATKDYERAIRLYGTIFQAVQTAATENEAEVEEKKKILMQIHTNLAVCYNKKEEWGETLKHIRQLEEIRSIDDQPKALYAKGVALMNRGELDNALAALVKVKKLKPLDNQVLKAIGELEKRKSGYKGFLKSFSKNLKLT